LGYASKTTDEYSRLSIGIWFLAAPLALFSWRVGARLLLFNLRSRGYNSRVVAIAGASQSALQIAEEINQSSWMGLRLAGYFDDRKPVENRVIVLDTIEGNFDQLIEMARNRRIDVIYIALPLKAAERIQQLIDRLADTTVSVYVVPEVFWTEVLRGRWINLGNLPTVSVFETPFYGLNGWLKRVEDIMLASVILLLISMPMLVIALGVRLSSPGPIFFKQKRYGLDGRNIEVWKFRSLRVCEDGGKVVQVSRDDKRVTAFGAFLRRTSLDELPQFINVIQGSMSIGGPRPHAVVHNEHYRSLIKGYMLRHKVKPGITGWAQINGWRGETETLNKMEQRIKHDIWYIHNWSFWLDLKIIALTMFKGFLSKNAY
jgi:putative colanic acid biosynthesis UDP-glucose lipid carrier transferase